MEKEGNIPAARVEEVKYSKVIALE